MLYRVFVSTCLIIGVRKDEVVDISTIIDIVCLVLGLIITSVLGRFLQQAFFAWNKKTPAIKFYK